MTYYARTQYTGNGSQTAYTFDWDNANGHYMATSDVYATLDSDATTAFTVVGNTLTFTSAPASGVAITIYRRTSLAIIEQFTRLGTPSSGAFSNIMRRLQYIGQELLDIGGATADSAYSALLASRWATLTGATVDGTDYSAKEHAVGTTVNTGSAKDWATKVSAIVAATDYSAKEYAQGSQASTGGSSKNWAQQTGADVTGAAANSRSAKSWAQEDLHGATLGGSAKDWAQSASKPDGTNESAKTYATQSAASATAAANSAAAAAASAAGLSDKGSCVVATTANLNATYSNGASGVGATLTNAGALAAFSVDGVSPSVGARVLVKDQTTAAQNGMYTLTTVGSGAVAWVLTRATDYDTSAEIVEGTFTIVESGTTQTGFIYVMTTSGTVTVGTTSLTFTALPHGTVTNVATGGLATGGPITGTGTVTVTASSVDNVETGTSTSVAVTPDALASIWEQGTDIASASTLTIPTTGGGYFNVTGTTTITAISKATVRAGKKVRLKFAGALTLTHNATSLILPTGANLLTAAGDVAEFVCEDATNNYWRCVSFMKANGREIQGVVVHLQDQKSAGTDGGGSTGGSWQTRTLNTKVTDVASICTLSGNQFTLPAGMYQIQAYMDFRNVGQAVGRIQNITDSTTAIRGMNAASGAASVGQQSSLHGFVTITGTKTFELQYYCTNTTATTGLGAASGSSTTEVYANVVIRKIG